MDFDLISDMKITHRSAIAPKIGFANNPTTGSIVYIVPTINDENPNWRMSVGIKGTTVDVPMDNKIRLGF